MAEIVNLRLARKRKARTDAADRAAENRALHGMSLTEKRQLKHDRQRASDVLDGHLRDRQRDTD